MTHHDIPGWYDWESGYEEVVRAFPGGLLVEVGCYLGRSLAHLGRLAKDSGKPFRAVGVDHCRGSGVEHPVRPDDVGGTDHHAVAVASGGGTFAGQLHKNLIDCGLPNVEILVTDSSRGSSFFADGSVDFVFLDAAHDYESVCRDIRAWLPKVRSGGWLAGDDYCDVWPGVKRAVSELLPGATPWSHDSWRYVKP